MALITNPQVRAFSNEKARLIADLIEKCRRTCEQFLIDIVEIENNAAFSGAQNADTIDDGADVDGRQVVTKLDLLGLKFVAEKMAEAANVDDRETIVSKYSVNVTPLF